MTQHQHPEPVVTLSDGRQVKLVTPAARGVARVIEAGTTRPPAPSSSAPPTPSHALRIPTHQLPTTLNRPPNQTPSEPHRDWPS